VAPSLLALVWGFHFLPDSINPQLLLHLHQAGAFICFLFLIGGVSRLARFNISHDAQPRNPGRPGRKYFVGMPIPAAAGFLASTVHLCYGISRAGVVDRHSLAGAGGAERIPDGEHLALLVGQGDQLSRSHPFQLLFVLAIVFYVMIRYSNVCFLRSWADVHVLRHLGARGIRVVAAAAKPARDLRRCRPGWSPIR
jgi:CDP-diacylglycerol--serine O-phosphatidyltransferase